MIVYLFFLQDERITYDRNRERLVDRRESVVYRAELWLSLATDRCTVNSCDCYCVQYNNNNNNNSSSSSNK